MKMNRWKITAILCVLLITFAWLTNKTGRAKAKVIHHATTSDKWGNITYNTLVVFENHRAITLTGTKYYFVPVGDSITYEYDYFEFPSLKINE
jgi:uncharacterized membrane protein (DUF106 family)